MKRCICIIMVLLIMLTTGCNSQPQQLQKPVNFYYYSDPITYDTAEGAISAEVRESAGVSDDLPALMNMYLQGPVSDDFTTPFPSGITVVNLICSNGTAKITLSEQFAVLSGFDLTAACVCITKTLSELADADTVVINVKNLQLDGKQSVTMRTKDIALWDTAADAPPTDE